MTNPPSAARRIAALLVAVLGAVLLVAVPAAPASAASASPGYDARLLVLINQARARAGLPILALYAPLSAQASAWSSRNASVDRLQHDPAYATKAGTVCDWSSARENVAYTTGSADSMFTAYMNSPGHRANILSRDTQFIGLGTVVEPWAAHPSVPIRWNTMRFIGGSCPEPGATSSATPTTATIVPMATPSTKGKPFVVRVALAAPAGPTRTGTLTFTPSRTGVERAVTTVRLVPGSTHRTYYRGSATVTQTESGTWRIRYGGTSLSAGKADLASSRAVFVTSR
jgi:hypothetical protein